VFTLWQFSGEVCQNEPDHRHRRLLRTPARAAEGTAAPPSASSFDVACHVTLGLGVIHAMEG
jgi:hypothetical protein